jgi:hypothetical protein
VHVEEEIPPSTPEVAELPEDGDPEVLDAPPEEAPELPETPPEGAPELPETPPEEAPELPETPPDAAPELLDAPPEEAPEIPDAPPDAAPELLELSPEEAPELPEPSPNDPDPPGVDLPSFEFEHATAASKPKLAVKTRGVMGTSCEHLGYSRSSGRNPNRQPKGHRGTSRIKPHISS